jgi:integrase/recombinase XerD
VPGRALPKTLSEDELDALLARPNLGCPTGLRNRAILAVLHRCGLRASEACGVHLRDVDWKAGEIRLRKEVAKGGREAVVYLDASTQEWLERWKIERRRHVSGCPYLFCTLRGSKLHRHYIWEMVSRYARKAGIERPVWPHQLRHTYATSLLAEGFTISEVQRLMRHARLQTTATYLEVRDVDLRRKVRERGRTLGGQ